MKFEAKVYDDDDGGCGGGVGGGDDVQIFEFSSLYTFTLIFFYFIHVHFVVQRKPEDPLFYSLPVDLFVVCQQWTQLIIRNISALGSDACFYSYFIC